MNILSREVTDSEGKQIYILNSSIQRKKKISGSINFPPSYHEMEMCEYRSQSPLTLVCVLGKDRDKVILESDDGTSKIFIMMDLKNCSVKPIPFMKISMSNYLTRQFPSLYFTKDRETFFIINQSKELLFFIDIDSPEYLEQKKNQLVISFDIQEVNSVVIAADITRLTKDSYEILLVTRDFKLHSYYLVNSPEGPVCELLRQPSNIQLPEAKDRQTVRVVLNLTVNDQIGMIIEDDDYINLNIYYFAGDKNDGPSDYKPRLKFKNAEVIPKKAISQQYTKDQLFVYCVKQINQDWYTITILTSIQESVMTLMLHKLEENNYWVVKKMRENKSDLELDIEKTSEIIRSYDTIQTNSIPVVFKHTISVQILK